MSTTASAIGAGIIFLGKESLQLIAEAAKGYIGKKFESLFTTVEKKLGKKERDALELAYADSMAHGLSAALDSLSNVLKLTGMPEDEMRQHRTEVLYFLENEEVAGTLWESICDLTDPQKPSATILEAEWSRTNWTLPLPGSAVWPMFALNFRKQAQEKAFLTPELRDILLAKNIDRIVELQHQLLGVQITVRQDQYQRVMLTRYAQVELASVAPAYAEDPGVLMVTDIFEPQHVRENPPSVEITKDEFEKLVRDKKLDRDGEDAVMAALEEDHGPDVAERLRFQRASYAGQAVRPVLSVISPTEALTPAGFRRHDRLCVITGEPGSGKSTLLRYLLLGILQPPLDPAHPGRPLPWTEGFTGRDEHFPLLIELRDYYFTCREKGDVGCFLDYINHLGESQGWGINAQWLHDRLNAGRSLVMFDGLDEIFDKRDRDTIMKEIAGFAATYPRAAVIVTSRPHGYQDTILRPAGFTHYRLQDLDAEQKECFVRAWFSRVFPRSVADQQARVERVLGAIRRSSSVRWLAGNPLLLTIMCLIGREKELPRERARFYEECVDVLAHKWDLNHRLQIEGLDFLGVDDKKDLLRRIAFHMQDSKAGLRGNFIGEQELLDIVEDWFRSEHEQDKPAASRAARQMIDGLWERNYLLCPRGPRLYGFLHRTFMEYLTAMEFVRRFQQTRDFGIDLLAAEFAAHGNQPEWAEVLRLICGSIGDQWAEGLIRTLLHLKPLPADQLDESNQPNHLVLAIRCLGELRGLGKLEALGIEALQQCVKFLLEAWIGTLDSDFIANEFLDAVAEIGERWPGHSELFGIIPETFGKPEPNRANFLPQFEALIRPDRGRMVSYATTHCDWTVRYNALTGMAGREAWADAATRHLLEQRAVSDENYAPRSQALQLLAGREAWADAATRHLLEQRAVSDENYAPRSQALQLLAGREAWADAATRLLLEQRAVSDENYEPRSQALQLLSGREAWADAATRHLLEQRAVSDEHYAPRSQALQLLAGREAWADAATRHLLEQRAVSDEHYAPRSQALRLLAGREAWADAATRHLLEQRTASDENYAPRSQALRLLAGREAWADAATRHLLEQRAVSDENYAPRSQALRLLAGREAWKESWQSAIGGTKEQITKAATAELRGSSATMWFASRVGPDGESPDALADAKRRVFTRDADGIAPYLDPLLAVPEEHLEGVWEGLGRDLPDPDFERMIAEMNADLGWDIRKGRPA